MTSLTVYSESQNTSEVYLLARTNQSLSVYVCVSYRFMVGHPLSKVHANKNVPKFCLHCFVEHLSIDTFNCLPEEQAAGKRFFACAWLFKQH